MTNADFAKDRLETCVKANVSEAHRAKIDGPFSVSPHDEGRNERLTCSLTSHRPPVELLQIDYSVAAGEFSGNVQILQREPVDFKKAEDYDKLLGDAFNDPEIMALIA